MPRIVIDGSELALAPSPPVWRDLLATIDGHLAATRRIVTDVRFDGLDDAAFRAPEALDRRLDDLSLVEVFSGTPASLMDRCLAEAIAAIPPLCRAATDIGEQYRGHDLHQANEGLSGLAEGLSSLVAIVSAAGLAFQVDLREMRSGDQAAAAVVTELGGFLEGLVGAQEGGDWITVADVLQYDVEPTLKRLAPFLESLRRGAVADVPA
jgi:hypothetical protein